MVAVRILHTSDWHLGRLFHGASLLSEQADALARVVDLVEEHRVELVVVAGDLYDRAVPPAEAVELFDRTLAELHGTGATVVAISGNHDSAVRISVGDRLLESVGVTIRGDAARVGDAVVVAPADGGPPVRVYPVPFLDPLATAHRALVDSPSNPGSGPRGRFTHHDAMGWAMDRVNADLDRHGRDCRSLVVAHAFLTGGDPSASERELTVGHVEQVGIGLFDGIDYVALGHLHRRQGFDGGRVGYSGAPLRYSFSEQDNVPSVNVVDMAPDGAVVVERVALGVGRGLRTLTGELEALLADPSLTPAEGCWVRAVLTDRNLPLQGMRRLRARFPHAVELRHEPPGAAAPEPQGRRGAQVRRSDPVALTREFLAERRGTPVDAEEDELVVAAFEQLTAERAS